MKQSVFASRLILAALFIFSGFVKSVDPMGTAIKIREYLFSFHMEELSDAAPWLAGLLCGTELLLGLFLLTGIFRKIVSYAVLLFMCFFTLLTFYILIADPVSDCGCFGDAIKLSNSATFVKNLFFSALAVFYFFHSFKIRERTGRQTAYAAILLALISFGIPVYSMEYLPVTDFLPYKTGVNLTRAMEIPDDALKSEYKTTLVYKNIQDGSLHEFEVEDTTWYDTSKWEYADTKTTLISQGYTPEIGRFSVLDKNGDDRLDDILSDSSYLFLFIMPDNNDTSSENLKKVQKLNLFARKHAIRFVTLTSGELEQTARILTAHDIRSESYNVDQTILKSLIRSRQHRGIILLKEGTILAKWNANHLPAFNSPADILTAIDRKSLGALWFYLILSVLFCSAVYLLVRQQGQKKRFPN